MKDVFKDIGRILGRQRRQAPLLGARELELMKALWRGKPLSAQQLLEASSEVSISLSTIQSTLERLYRKQLVSREKSGRYYLYQATVSQSEFIGQLMGNISQEISDGNLAPMISGFMSFIDEETPDSLPPKLHKLMKKLAADDD